MSFHELINGYPWMTKRTARVLDPAAALPRATARLAARPVRALRRARRRRLGMDRRSSR